MLKFLYRLYAGMHGSWRYRTGYEAFDNLQLLLERSIGWRRKYDLYFSVISDDESLGKKLLNMCNKLMPDLVEAEGMMSLYPVGYMIRGLVSAWNGRELTKGPEMKVGVRFNKETKKYDVVDDSTSAVLMHETHGNRVDGGGHKEKASAERQAGYLQKYYDKKDKEWRE